MLFEAARTLRVSPPQRMVAQFQRQSIRAPAAQRFKQICLRRRSSSSSSSSGTQAPSAYADYYRTFGRPVAKVFLGSLFVYQLVYWAWLRLEADEERSTKDGQIRELEDKIVELSRKSKGQST